MKVRVAVPRRPDGGRRDELWAFCRSWWGERFPDWEIVCADVEGVFNRGAAINRAAEGEWDVLVVLDADVVAEAPQVAEAVERAASTGRLTLAYDNYAALDRSMSNRVLSGFNGQWVSRPSPVAKSHCSSIVVVARQLWEAIGGFDERCTGWGYDDTILTHVARVLCGGIERVPGTVYHLWHPPSPHANINDPGCRAAAALAQRYFATYEPDEVKDLVVERRHQGVAVIVLTDGRRDCIERSLPSALSRLKNLSATGTRQVWICDDSGDLEYQAWLRLHFGHVARIVCGRKRLGYSGAVRRAWEVALASGCEYVFWLEDDFTFNVDVDVRDLIAVLESDERLTQIVLKRQAWFDPEVAVGGYVERDPDAYDEVDDPVPHLVHTKGHWMNPHLTTRRFLAGAEWPKGPNSESRFAVEQRRRGKRFAILGRKSDPPVVHHEGARGGTGY